MEQEREKENLSSSDLLAIQGSCITMVGKIGETRQQLLLRLVLQREKIETVLDAVEKAASENEPGETTQILLLSLRFAWTCVTEMEQLAIATRADLELQKRSDEGESLPPSMN